MTKPRAALALGGLFLFALGALVGYLARGAEHLAIDAPEAAAFGGAAAARDGEGVATDAGAETSHARAARAAAPTSGDPARAGTGGTVETIGGEGAVPRAGTPAGGAAETARGAAPLTDGGRPRGRLDAAAIREVVREHRDQLGFCFAWQLHQNPDLRGSITMEFTIGEDGRVTRAEVADDQLGDETVLRCFRGVTSRMRFPAPEGGEVQVRYPFHLAPEPDPEGDRRRGAAPPSR